MAQYSIKDLENFTKIKAHTLRIWEQRYELLSPQRTETNIRFYSDNDLKKILNINLLYQNGLKISKIAKLTEKEIFQQASEILLTTEVSGRDEINSFVEHILGLNESAIQESLHRINDKIGLERLYPEVLIPLLEKIGTLWQVNAISVSHEHFLSNILREFLITQITNVDTRAISEGKVVLFLAEHEKHELSLLFYYYLLKKKGFDCFYLGQSVPMKDLKSFVNETKPDIIVTSLIAEVTSDTFKKLFSELTNLIDPRKIFAGGYQLLKHKIDVPEGVKVVQSIDDIKIS
ncbi:MAG: DNA-binding transcriptional MerR regulator/methylmalonyl-CoA mutase cobalamin-binding subunit [Arenicella sp.]|jgi:DNA-binding transcriptional MerR regulator/methylmalonyl-CoA mutase cobalamin-binding subunit